MPCETSLSFIFLKSAQSRNLPNAPRCDFSDEPKPLEHDFTAHDFTAYDTPG